METVCAPEQLTFFGRVGLAMRLVFNGDFAREVCAALQSLQKKATTPTAPPPEKLHASGLLVLSLLQREGRLLDFLQQDIAGFSDDEIGAAARVVHSGCRKVINQYLKFDPAIPNPENSAITVPTGFDAQRIRLTGNVAGQPPFQGSVKHHGWVAKEITLPAPSESLDPRVVAPAEVELS